MNYCFNLDCKNPSDFLNANKERCQTCGQTLLLTLHNEFTKSYRGIQLLGEGGFGKLIEVEDDVGRRQVLKSLRLHKLFNNSIKKKAISLFKQEAQVLSKLHHPGIPRVEPGGYFTWPERMRNPSMHCFVMEKIDGSNLQDWLSVSGNWPLTQEQVISWLKQLVEILHEIHRKNYIHRDIKPSNIMRRLNGQLVLIDFGAVRELTDTYLRKIQGSTLNTSIGSFGYTPQEQHDGRAVQQSDFFALGRTFVYILTGKHPTSQEFATNHETGKFNWRVYAPDVSQAFADLIDALIEPSLGHRPRNTQVILESIDKLKENIHKSRQLVIFQKPEPTTIEPENSPVQNTPTTTQSSVVNVVGDIVGEAVEREVSSAIVARRQISLENLIKQIQEVGLQRTLRQIREELSEKFQHRLKVPRYIILLLLIVAVPAVHQIVTTQRDHKKLAPKPTDESSDPRTNTVGNSSPVAPIQTTQLGSRISQTPKYFSPYSVPKTEISPYVRSVIFSPNGKLIAISYTDDQVQIRQSDTGILMLTRPGGKRIEFSPDGQILALVSRDEKVQLWDVKTGKLRSTLSRN